MLYSFLLSFLLLQLAIAEGPPDHSAEGFQYTADCAKKNNWSRVEANSSSKAFLAGMSKKVSQRINVYSCFRSQESQDEILKKNKCAPRFGTVECSGRIAADKSEHTLGAAADFIVTTSLPPNSPDDIVKPELRRYCRALDQNRRQTAKGRGGLTIYGIGPDSVAYLHFDPKSDWCNWGPCEFVLGEGHCKRKKYRVKEAELEKKLATARELRAKADILRLKAELKRLRAYCPPGDLTCRDSYKD